VAVLILMFGPVSGAHFNPVVTVADWLLGRRRGTGLPGSSVGLYLVAQVVGGIAGAVLANVMFDLPAVQISGTERATSGHGIGEIVATAGLVALIFLLARTGRHALSAAAVGAYIGAAYWFASSTSFANPRCDGWPDLLRHLRRDRAFVSSAVRRRADHRCRHLCGSCRRTVPAQQHSPGHGICWA
jgi:glycerol uptake facilitator-like aquaporin